MRKQPGMNFCSCRQSNFENEKSSILEQCIPAALESIRALALHWLTGIVPPSRQSFLHTCDTSYRVHLPTSDATRTINTRYKQTRVLLGVQKARKQIGTHIELFSQTIPSAPSPRRLQLSIPSHLSETVFPSHATLSFPDGSHPLQRATNIILQLSAIL